MQVFEQSAEIGEIGAGIQLQLIPSRVRRARQSRRQGAQPRSLHRLMVMHDALDERRWSAASRPARPSAAPSATHAVIHRVDITPPLLEGAVRRPGASSSSTSTRIEKIEQDQSRRHRDRHRPGTGAGPARRWIGADGGKSVVCAQYVNDPPRATGHVVYRAVVVKADSDDLKWNAAPTCGPAKCHLMLPFARRRAVQRRGYRATSRQAGAAA